MTRRSSAAIVTLAISLSACGGSTADQALSRMHDTYLKQAMSNLEILVQSDLSRTTTNIAFSTKRSAKTVAVGERDFGIIANAELKIASEMSSDVRNPRIPLADGMISFVGSITAPAGTFTGMDVQNAPPETATADIAISARSVAETILLRISGVSVVTPMMPKPFELPAEMSSRWYGITFDALDALLAKQATETGGTPAPPVRELLSKSFGNRVSPAALLKLWKSVHIWNGLELLPEENGLVRIRVESDKKKVQTSVRAFVEYIKETSGQSWDSQLERSPEMKKNMESLLADDAEFMKTMGTVKGVLSADKETYEFMGFDGEILDASGKVKAVVTILRTKDGDFSASLTNTETQEGFVIQKQGERLTGGAMNGKNAIEGTVSMKAVDLTVKDPETGKEVTSIAFAINEMTPTSLSISDGTVKIPSEKLTIHVRALSVKINPPDSVTMRIDSSAEVGSSQQVTLEADLRREAIPSLKVEKPAFQPIESLYQDLLQVLIGSADAGGPEVAR